MNWCRSPAHVCGSIKMKELKMTYQYVEVPGGTHGSVLTTGAPDIFAFFAKHSKSAR